MPFLRRTMDRLRRTLSLRRRKDHTPDSNKPQQWQIDEAAVRAGTCQFHVRYLGCVEVYESRGMQVCEDAFKALRNTKRKPIRAVLHVGGDGLRVVDGESNGLIVDQTIEKVSFCAPDRNYDKGFSYICRDGTTRRWMCHGFLAIKETGERLSHAVGCAFAVCLERKQKRDKECNVEMQFNKDQTSFSRLGSFRQASLTDRLADPQDVKPAEPKQRKESVNTHAVDRPHASADMLQKQFSFRGLGRLNQTSPFKRQLSLKVGELPSNVERKDHFVNPSMESAQNGYSNNPEQLAAEQQKTVATFPIVEASPTTEADEDVISSLCKQISEDLLTMTSQEDSTSRGAANQQQQAKASNWPGHTPPRAVRPPHERPPPLAHLRSHSLDHTPRPVPAISSRPQASSTSSDRDPFNTDWAASSTSRSTTNPFATSSSTGQTFEVKM